MSKPIFYKGQQVGCLMHGEGVVGEVLLTHESNIINCVFKNNNYYYTIDGRYATTTRPTLYPIEQYRAIIANLPAPEPEKWQPKPGEVIWVYGHKDWMPNLRKFIKMNDKEYVCEDVDGNISNVVWPYAAPFIGELPQHLKEVQP